ncbi:MAG: type III PLP-dependent enzyme [Ottowia sp.]|nr:type III PLP-dependent enzyme [Ottowia sp.]
MNTNWPKIEKHLQQLLNTTDEPLCAYVYDLDALQEHIKQLRSTLPTPNCELFYAIKANSDVPILRALAPWVHGFEVSSGGELAWVREYFPHTPIIFSGPGKTDQELTLALEKNVAAIHIESRTELERLAYITQRLNQPAKILLRINFSLHDLAPTRLMMGGGPTPFGIALDQLPACLDTLRRYPQIHLQGFHFHLLSHQLDADAHIKLLDTYLQQTHKWCQDYHLTIDHINVGGGIGVNYQQLEQQFAWPIFAQGLQQLVLKHGKKIRMECGRYITAACGYYAAQVIDIKEAFGDHYAIIRGGTHHFRTPYAQGHSHPFQVMPVTRWAHPYTRTELSAKSISVVGQLCTPKDLLAFKAPIKRIRCGDLVVFPYAGAYAWHISHHDFLRHPHPQHHYLLNEISSDATH